MELLQNTAIFLVSLLLFLPVFRLCMHIVENNPPPDDDDVTGWG